MSEDGQVCLPLLQLLKVALELPVTFRALEGGESKVKVKERSKAKAGFQTSPFAALLKVQSLEMAGEKAGPGPGPGVRVGEAPEGNKGANSNAYKESGNRVHEQSSLH